MADSSKRPDTTELVEQLLERLAISLAHEDQAAVIAALQTASSENRKAVESLKADYDKKIADLEMEKDELKAFVSTIQNDIRNLKLQVTAQDGLRVYHKNFLHSAVASPKTLSQQGEQFKNKEDAIPTDLDAAVEPEMPPSDPDVSMTLTAFTLPTMPAMTPRYATPEFTIAPPNFVTPKHLIGYGATTPSSVNTVKPDTVGFNQYDGPFQIPRIVPFAESSDHDDENVFKRLKRVRRHSVAPLETLTLSPITEDKELPELEPVTGLDKTLWRESWQQSGKPGTLEDYARKQKMAMLFSDITNEKERPRKRYTASEFDKLPAPEQNKRKRARHQPNTAQPLAAVDLNASQLPATKSMPPLSSSQRGRPSRASKIPGRFGGNDILTGQAFLAATNPRSALASGKGRNQAADPSQDEINTDGDDDDDPQTQGKAASSLLQQFGSRETKVSKRASK
ncbi:hypothetical protein E2P81_ATG09675 [Venturia nashicola]|uniref:Uncharacterized protein n=1 Tax=Venturia nashicola TaxID=86259 RepID=A0A4Z1NMN3_9PEZI|nr:hypothetical protein E6O75_ATG09885 [Venturia nashicola]TLD26018.1 hypothetical protein E2P81_ATG09675 [Venturia nashicola]